MTKCHLKSRASSRGDHSWWFELLHQLVHVSRMRTRHNNPWMKRLSKSGGKRSFYNQWSVCETISGSVMFVQCVRRDVQWSVAEKWFLLSGLLLLYDMPLPAAPFNALHFLTRQPAWVLHRVTVYDINLPFNALDFSTRRPTQLIHRALHCVTL